MFLQSTIQRALQFASLTTLLALAACGGSGSNLASNGGGGGNGGDGGGITDSNVDCTQPKSTDDDGCIYVSMTDEAGDFLTYTVSVTRFTITKRDGTEVNVLPHPITVDFAQYNDLSEYLALGGISTGDYQGGKITLDFTHADIQEQSASGTAVQLTPVDGSGKTLTTQDVGFTLDSDHPFDPTAGVPHVLGVDFDLDASNSINNTKKTVTVHPFLVATVDPSDGKLQRIHGSLDSVDTGGGDFTLELHPFRATSEDYGKLAAHGVASTVYVVDGKMSLGSTGLSALKSAGSGTAVLARGQFDFSSHRFVADRVFAGSSAPGGTSDAVEGIVTKRSGNTLTLRGANIYRAGGSASFHDTVTVIVDTSTVVREGERPKITFHSDDISVGQKLLVFGDLTAATHLDAGGGFALLEETPLDGSVLTINSGGSSTQASIDLDVQAIGGRDVSAFDFSGTNSDSANYEVRLPCSCLSTGVNTSDPVRVTGFVTPFGSAQPDFKAQTLVDYDVGGSAMTVSWPGTGTASAFTDIDVHSGIVLDLDGSSHHSLRRGGATLDLKSLATAPTVKGEDIGSYSLLQNGEVHGYVRYSDFLAALQDALSGGAKVRGLFARGGFSITTDILDSNDILVSLD